MTAVAASRPRSLPLLGATPAPVVHPPPFSLTAAHFLAALLWLGLGSAGFVVVAQQLAAGNLFDPRVFAVVHCVTLGVVTTAIFGALYQLFPVTMGRAARHLGTAYLTFALLQLGTILVVAGFWYADARWQGAGWSSVALATLLLGVNLVSQCLDTKPDRLIGRYVGGGYLALVAALGLGLLRIGEALGYGHVDRLAMIATHFHLAAFGFATLITVGVGHRMLPMFLVSHGAPRWPFRWTGPVTAVGLILFAVGELSGRIIVGQLGAATLAVAGGLYLYLTREYFRRRAVRRLDPGLAHVAVAHLFLAVSMVGGVALSLREGGFNPHWWAAYGVTVLGGWLVLLIVGVLYKILPFLTWLHLFGARMGQPKLPTVADLTRPRWAWISLVALTCGLLIDMVAIAVDLPMIARGGAFLLLAGVLLALAQVARVLNLRYLR